MKRNWKDAGLQYYFHILFNIYVVFSRSWILSVSSIAISEWKYACKRNVHAEHENCCFDVLLLGVKSKCTVLYSSFQCVRHQCNGIVTCIYWYSIFNLLPWAKITIRNEPNLYDIVDVTYPCNCYCLYNKYYCLISTRTTTIQVIIRELGCF